jgi:purine-nucleoside phosphorylase
MNKNFVGTEKAVTISATLLDDCEMKKIFGEPVMKICWEEFGGGAFVGMESQDAYVFTTDFDKKHCISAIWDHWNITAAVDEASRSEGVDGVIKVCMDFVSAFAADLLQWLAEPEETA